MNEPFKDTSDYMNSTPVSIKEHITAVIEKSSESKKELFKCEKCEYKCKKQVTLKKHMHTKHEAQHCKVCSQMFVSTTDLLQHIVKEHSSNEMTHKNNTESQNQDNVLEAVANEEKDTNNSFVSSESWLDQHL